MEQGDRVLARSVDPKDGAGRLPTSIPTTARSRRASIRRCGRSLRLENPLLRDHLGEVAAGAEAEVDVARLLEPLEGDRVLTARLGEAREVLRAAPHLELDAPLAAGRRAHLEPAFRRIEIAAQQVRLAPPAVGAAVLIPVPVGRGRPRHERA